MVNFTDKEIAKLAKCINANTGLAMRINKYGNLDVKHKASKTAHYVFYKHYDGLVIRRRTWVGNGKGINQHGGYLRKEKFSTMTDAVNYFKNYISKREKALYTESHLY